jgi:hypothetical protein
MRIIYHSIDKACNIMIIYHNLKTNKIDEEYTHAQHRPEILSYLELNLLSNLIDSSLIKLILFYLLELDSINVNKDLIYNVYSKIDTVEY